MASAMSGDEIQAKIEEVRPTISPLLEEAGKFDSRIVAVKSEIMHVLESKGLAYRAVVHSSFVGVHPENRYGDGIVPFNVHSLISDMFAHGFSFDACSDATASEVPPHDCPTREWFQQFNDELMTGAAGMLPAYKDTIKIVSLTCGHCSQGLRAIHEGVQSDQEEVSDNGCLSLEKIALRDRKYANACKEGIPWRVIRWQVEKHSLTLPMWCPRRAMQGNKSPSLRREHKSCLRFTSSPSANMHTAVLSIGLLSRGMPVARALPSRVKSMTCAQSWRS